MAGNAVYLEAPERTQDLLNIKWTLLSAGWAIGSSWHDGEVNTLSLAFQDHWNARGVEQLQACDSLVVVCGKSDRAALELGMMAAFALARGLRVIWIGSPVRVLNNFRAVQQFNTPEDFRRQIIRAMAGGLYASASRSRVDSNDAEESPDEDDDCFEPDDSGKLSAYATTVRSIQTRRE